MTPPKTIEQLAEEYALDKWDTRMRGDHLVERTVIDFLAGHASRDAEVEGLKAKVAQQDEAITEQLGELQEMLTWAGEWRWRPDTAWSRERERITKELSDRIQDLFDENKAFRESERKLVEALEQIASKAEPVISVALIGDTQYVDTCETEGARIARQALKDLRNGGGA